MKIFLKTFIEVSINDKVIASKNIESIGDEREIEKSFSHTFNLSKKWDANDFEQFVDKHNLNIVIKASKRKGKWFQGYCEFVRHYFYNSNPVITVTISKNPDVNFYELKYYPAENAIEYLKDRGITSIRG